MSAGVLNLIGDSVLDNGTYVAYTGLPGSHSVTDWLRRKLEPKGWVVHLKAIDGDVIAGMPAQIETVPKDTTHVVISIGGNDGLSELSKLRSRGLGPCNVFSAVSNYKAKLTDDYRDMLSLVEKKLPGVKIILLTIYHPPFPNALHRWIAWLGTRAAGGVIKAEAARRGLPVVDVASIFNDDLDFANPIEPGVPGGDKIANNVVAVLERHDFSQRQYAEYSSTDLSDDAQRYREELRKISYHPHRPIILTQPVDAGAGDNRTARARNTQDNDEFRGEPRKS